MENVPCSHVGHIFRSWHPYFIPEDSHGINTARMAEVWMDDYKRLFYMHRQVKIDTPHTVVLRKTQKMHIKNNKHSAAAFYMVIHIQKEFKLYLSIQLRSGHFGIISNLAPFMMALQQGA